MPKQNVTLKHRFISSNDLRVCFEIDGAPQEEVSLCGSDVEALIQRLSVLRAEMKPPISESFSPPKFSGESDPLWKTLTQPGSPDKILAIRHHGIGWLSFLLPTESARKLGKDLCSGQLESGAQSQNLH